MTTRRKQLDTRLMNVLRNCVATPTERDLPLSRLVERAAQMLDCDVRKTKGVGPAVLARLLVHLRAAGLTLTCGCPRRAPCVIPIAGRLVEARMAQARREREDFRERLLRTREILVESDRRMARLVQLLDRLASQTADLLSDREFSADGGVYETTRAAIEEARAFLEEPSP